MNCHESYALSIVDRSIDQLKPYAQNARTHSKQQIRQIADSSRPLVSRIRFSLISNTPSSQGMADGVLPHC